MHSLLRSVVELVEEKKNRSSSSPDFSLDFHCLYAVCWDALLHQPIAPCKLMGIHGKLRLLRNVITTLFFILMGREYNEKSTKINEIIVLHSGTFTGLFTSYRL